MDGITLVGEKDKITVYPVDGDVVRIFIKIGIVEPCKYTRCWQLRVNEQVTSYFVLAPTQYRQQVAWSELRKVNPGDVIDLHVMG